MKPWSIYLPASSQILQVTHTDGTPKGNPASGSRGREGERERDGARERERVFSGVLAMLCERIR